MDITGVSDYKYMICSIITPVTLIIFDIFQFSNFQFTSNPYLAPGNIFIIPMLTPLKSFACIIKKQNRTANTHSATRLGDNGRELYTFRAVKGIPIIRARLALNLGVPQFDPRLRSLWPAVCVPFLQRQSARTGYQ